MELTTQLPLRLQHPVVRPGDETLRIDLDQPVTALAISSTGALALGTHRGMISVRDAQTGRERAQLLGHRRRVHAVAFAPDGERLYSVSRDGALRCWSTDGSSSTELWRGRLSLNACDTDGHRIIAAGDDGIVRSWLGDQRESELRGHRGMVTAAVLLRDGARAISGGVDGVLILWDLASGQGKRLYRHAGAVTSCALSEDGTLLLSGGTDGVLRVWDLTRGRAVGAMSGHDGPVTSCAISADGSQALSGSSDRTVMAWNIQSGKRSHTFYSHDREISSVAWWRGQAWSTSADRSARCWALDDQPETPDYKLRHIDGVTSCAFSADGTQLISASLDYTMRVWDVATGASVQTLRGHHGAVRDAALSPGGRVLASVSNDGEIRLWAREGAQWSAGLVFASGQGPLARCNFLSEDLLLTAGRDGAVRAWSLMSGRALFELDTRSDDAMDCGVLSDSRIITASITGTDGAIGLWAAGELKKQLNIDSPVTACVTHPDGQSALFSAMDGCVWSWAPDHATEPTLLYRHDGPATALAISPEGALLSVGEDGTLRRHDLKQNHHEQLQLTWPLTAVGARAGWVAAGDRAGNLWVFTHS
ncbi:MAG: WD40 repeat protein [Myxococcota bacterium]|jgi:WD40 repeat protein